MKRILALALALLLIGGIALAESLDYASMTDEELQAILEGVQAELKSRKSGDEYWYDDNDIRVYPAGATKYNDLMNLYQYAITVENNTDKIINLSCSAVVNGWSVTASGVLDIQPGKTVKDFIGMFVKDAGATCEDDIETFDVTFKIYGDDFKTIAEFGPITVDLK